MSQREFSEIRWWYGMVATMLGLHILRHITAHGLAGSLGERMVKVAN